MWGKGIVFLISTPDKKLMLIDAGRDFSTLEELSPQVAEIFGQKVDVLMLSHPDADHAGVMAEILEKYEASSHIYEQGEA